MTISTEDRVAGPFLGDDIVTLFPFEFKVFAKADVRVIKTDALGIDIETGAGLTLDLDYSIALNADQDNDPGGDITYPLGGSSFPTLSTGEKLTATSDIPELQTQGLPSGGPWNPVIVENALDRSVMLIQQLSQQIDRMLRGPISDVATIGDLPTATARALRFLAFDAIGDPIEATTITTSPVTAFMATVLDDTTADAGLTTFGFTAHTLSLRSATTPAASRTILEAPSEVEIQDGGQIYALDTGTANAVLIALSPALTAYGEGQKFRSHKLVINTGAVTVDVDSLGPVPLNAPDGSALLPGQLAAGQPFEFIRHTSSQFRVTSAFPLSFGNSVQRVLKDPTITRDTADSFTVGAFQCSPLNAVVPLISTSGNLVRQATGLFERTAAAAPKGISEQTGALAVAAEFTATDVSFTAGTAIDAASGTPFSNFVAGDKIVVDGSSLNEGTFEVATLVGGGTGVTTVEAIVTESAGASITIYRIAQDDTLHLHAVRETATGNVAVAVDDNKAGTNIGTGASAGWTQVRRMWSLLLDGSTDIEDFTKIGDHCKWAIPVTSFSTGVAVGRTTVSMKCPDDLFFDVDWEAHFVVTNCAGSGQFIVTDLADTDVSPTAGLSHGTAICSGDIAGETGASGVTRSNTLGQLGIRWVETFTVATLYFNSFGYYDYRID